MRMTRVNFLGCQGDTSPLNKFSQKNVIIIILEYKLIRFIISHYFTFCCEHIFPIYTCTARFNQTLLVSDEKHCVYLRSPLQKLLLISWFLNGYSLQCQRFSVSQISSKVGKRAQTCRHTEPNEDQILL